MAVMEHSLTTCTICGEPLESGWPSCPACGSTTNSGTVLSCPHCGKGVKANWRQCPQCQTSLDGHATPSGNSGNGSATPRRSGTEAPQVFGPATAAAYPAERGRLIEPPLVAGDILGKRYTIRSRLGAGGFGAVFQAFDSVTQEDVALKIVVAAEGEGRSQRAIEQILHEFKLRQKITDVAHVVKCGDPRPCDFKGLSLVLLPMELAAEGSLRHWLERCESIDRRRTEGLALFHQACLGVKAIHDAGLVHLDIKPENILLSDGRAKITDFGIGRFGPGESESNPDQLLRQGVGTPQYMSPEQFRTARQKDIGPASDIYTLGVVLYEILDGALPFDGSPVELRDKHLTLPPARLTGSAERWWGVVDRCLAKAPADRYPSADALLKDLRHVQQSVAAGVDVACPKCRHLNSNPEHKVCEACLARLDVLFRPCPRCAKDVRLDMERCTGCGAAVQAIYVHRGRLGELERLKDEDLGEAIALFELMLRDGADMRKTDSEDPVQTLRKMREDQQRVCGSIDLAEQATADGAPDRALRAWREVLDLVPRHRVALEKAAEVERLLSEFQGHLAKGLSLLDQAEFTQGEQCLQQCLKLIPQSADAKRHLQNGPRRAQTYSAAMQDARRALNTKQVAEALDHLKLALVEAPQAAEALGLRTTLDKVIKGTEGLLTLVKQRISRALFEEAERDLISIEGQRSDAGRLEALKSELRQKREAYTQAMDEGERAAGVRDLGAAVEKIERAMKICPESSRAQAMLKKLRDDQEGAARHLQKAKGLLPTAEFAGAGQEIEHARGLWSTMPGLNEAGVNLKSTQSAYERHIDDAQRALAKKAFDDARSACDSALSVCPRSRQVGQLQEQINEAMRAEETRKARKAHKKKNRHDHILSFAKMLLILVVGAALVGALAWMGKSAWSWAKVFNWGRIVEHQAKFATGWGVLLFLTACVHRRRYTNLFNAVFSSLFHMRSDRKGAAFFVIALLQAVLSGLPAAGVYYLAGNHFGMTSAAAITLGGACGCLVQIVAFFRAITSRCRWRLA